MRGQAAIEQPCGSAARSLKGQAAIEYLTTYGWAILALVIVLGVLLFSGVLSPTYLISEECSLSSNLPCQFGIVSAGDKTTLSVNVTNGFQYKIKIIDFNVSGKGGEATGFSEKLNQEIESGSTFAISEKQIGGTLPPNSVVRLTVNISYASCAPELFEPPQTCSDSNHTIVGKITGRVIHG